MFRYVFALAFAGALSSILATDAAAQACRMTIIFDNNHSEEIRVKFLFGPPWEVNAGSREQMGNVRLDGGEEGGPGRRQNLANGKIGKGALFIGPNDVQDLAVSYELRVNGSWQRRYASYDAVQCRHNRVLTLDIPSTASHPDASGALLGGSF